MSGYLIFGLVIIGFFLSIWMIVMVKIYLRKLEFKDWEVDDLIIVNSFIITHRLNNNGKKFAKVKGWTVDNVFLDLGDDYVNKYSWDVVGTNKSALWRRNVKECESTMGKKPGFVAKVNDEGVEPPNSGDKIDGKPIILLTETECQAYLKQAIDSENYDMAEKIRKQMEKYR
jgi:hypothetical protein